MKVLDPPEVPESKVFPPRLFIIVLGTIGALVLALVWILRGARWKVSDPQDPVKILASEISQTMTKQILRTASHRPRWAAFTAKLRNCHDFENKQPNA